MEEIKEKIAKKIVDNLECDIDLDEVISKIEIPKDTNNGDLAYPCFNLAKKLKQSPMIIAKQLSENIKLDDEILRIEIVNGYLNFYLDSSNIASNVLGKIMSEKENYGITNVGKGKKIVIDYSSPNIAKPFHLGHFRNTVLGSCIYKLYENQGYDVIGINHLGDWGRQFGLLIEGYELFKDEYDITKNPLKVLSEIYVRINKLAKDDETVMDKARANFQKLEQGDEKYQKTWEFFRKISLEEYDRIYKILDCKFDSYNGEAFYKDKTSEVIQMLDEKGVLVDSQGAKVVEVGEDMPPCIILKSNGSTIYATRDLAAILYRVRNYDFYKAIYITANDQILHFKQVFKTAKYLVDEKYIDGLIHVYYGMVRLKTGKMSSRDGTVIYVNDLINEAIEKAKIILREKNTNLENVDLVSKQIGIGALVFNYLKTTKVKDVIFDLDESLKFDGNTGPYVQYTYVRTKSILEKLNFDFETIYKDIDLSVLNKKQELDLIKALSQFEEVLKKAASEYEPSELSKYLLELSTLFSRFYNECSVVNAESQNLKIARGVLVFCTGIVIQKGLKILGIDCPDKM